MNDRLLMNRRSFLVTSGLTATTLALAGCASGADGGSGSSKVTKISGAGWQDGVTDLVFGPIATQFQKKTGITVDEQASVPFDDYQTRFRTLIAGGSPPDAMRLNDDFLREMSDKKSVLDLAPFIKDSGLDLDEYFKSVWKFSDMPTGHRAVVIGTQPRVIFYNKTLFENAGVPLPPKTWTSEGWTWDDFLTAAEALSKGSEQYGAVVDKDTGFENTFSVNNGGPGIFSKDGRKFTLADPEGYEAIQWVADLALKHKAAAPWAVVQPEKAEQRLFTAGKLGMLFGASSGTTYFQQNIKDFEWDIAPVPAKVRQRQEGSMIVFVIPTKSQHPDQAWQFLDYVVGPDGGKVLAESGACIPVNKKAADSLSSGGKAPKNVKLLAAAADHNSSVNSTTATSQAVAIYRPQLERVYIGDITAKEALTSVRSQVEAALAKG